MKRPNRSHREPTFTKADLYLTPAIEARDRKLLRASRKAQREGRLVRVKNVTKFLKSL